MEKIIKLIRQAFADYVVSEGCSCCRDEVGHTRAEAELAKLLKVPKHEDGSGYDFRKFQSVRD